MNNKPKEQELLAELDGDLREAVRLVRDDAPKKEAVHASVGRMSKLVSETKASGQDQLQRKNARPNVLRKVGWITAAAASLLVAAGVLYFVTKPKLSLAAQIVNSIAAQDWVRATETYPGGAQCETWFSPSRNISALSNQERIEYRDHNLAESYEFIRADQTIYRVSESEFTRRYSRWSQLATSLPVLLADGLPDQPLDSIFGAEELKDRVEFVGHDIEPSVEVGELEYSIRCLLDEKPLEIVLHLDANTKLPIRSVIIGSENGNEITMTTELNYLNSGPQDIYDLGVPVGAKLVNRVESDMARFLKDAVRAGTDKFDDYRATMVQHRVGDAVWWRNARVEVICKKGDRFTRRWVARIFEQRGKSGPDDDDPIDQWWEERVRTAHNGPDGTPYNIMIGDDIWDFDSNEGTYEKRKHGNDGYHNYSLRPDMIARPAMGGSAADLEIRIDENPDTGPAGTILYELFISSTQSVNRYWIDPERGYLAVQWDIGSDDQWTHRTTVEKAAQSPSGIWYPQQLLTKSRRGETVREDITDCYVDFETEIPDRLFKVK